MYYYTGIGARKTPLSVQLLMSSLAVFLVKETDDPVLRSGAADGADTAFENGCDYIQGRKEIYLPWHGFNKSKSLRFNIPKIAFDIGADMYGPTWKHLKPYVKNLMARNIQQVLGTDATSPSKFVLCWTPDGCESRETRSKTTGGTGQAIACAYEWNIPVFNLKNGTDDFYDFIQEMINDQ